MSKSHTSILKWACLALFILFCGTISCGKTPPEMGSNGDDFQHKEIVQDVESLREAAEQGDPSAQNELGIAYLNGLGVEQDFDEALRWFRSAADKGNTMAQVSLGFMYDYGRGVEQDYKKAFSWYKKAADAKNLTAQFNLFYMYVNGYGVQEDKDAAVKWLRSSAEGGLPAAQTKLGNMHRTGVHVKKDLKAAVKWLRRAAEQGDPEAQYHLAKHYGLGYGVKQDPIQAYLWHQIMIDSMPQKQKEQFLSKQGNSSSQLTTDQLAEAAELIKAMKQKILINQESLKKLLNQSSEPTRTTPAELTEQELISIAIDCWENDMEAQKRRPKEKNKVLVDEARIMEMNGKTTVWLPFKAFSRAYILINISSEGKASYSGYMVE